MALQRLAACLLWAVLLTGHRSAQALDPQAKRREAFIGYSERHRDIINLQTSHGQIRVALLPDNAPRTVAAIKELAVAPSCSGCRFYRSERPPESGFGPPYGLLQGSLGGMKETPPLEGEMTARRGHACTIPGTAEFFIAAVDHPEWGHAHTVFGQVSDMQVVDAILEKEAYHDYINPDYGTLMRMLDSELPLNVVLAHNSQTLARTTT